RAVPATGHPAPRGCPPGRPAKVHPPADTLGHEIVAGARVVRAGLAKAGDRAIDQARIGLAQARVVEAELGKPPDLEILDQHVRACRQLLDDTPSVLALEIELDRAFAAVGGVEIGGVEMAPAARPKDGRPPAPRVLPRPFALDLDDVGTEVGKNLPGPGPRQDAGKLEHA